MRAWTRVVWNEAENVMDDTPPRRSRRPKDNRKDATFPLIPFLIGVVVLGFVIGAGLSMAGHHGSRQQVASAPVVTPQPTDTPAPTLAPLSTHRPIVATEAPAETESTAPQTPEPKVSATEKPSPKASPHVALASLPPTASASVAQAQSPVAKSITAVPLHSHAPTVVAHQAPPPVAVKTTAPSIATAAPIVTAAPATAAPATAAPATAAAASIEADSDFGRLSANAVKQYLRALARGDTESAAGAFTPGSSTAYPERAVLDSTAQIGTISARGSSETQTVNATISNSSGSYIGTYTVHRTSTGAAVIVSHSISKS